MTNVLYASAKYPNYRTNYISLLPDLHGWYRVNTYIWQFYAPVLCFLFALFGHIVTCSYTPGIALIHLREI